MYQEHHKTVDILLVDDNPADVELTLEVLNDIRMANRIFVAGDGIEGLAFLRREPPHANAPRPDLILLNLNMPRMDGRELLEHIKNDETLRRIPVVVLSTSQTEADILKTYDLHANCFITKPVDIEQFVAIARSIETFWLTLVKLPCR